MKRKDKISLLQSIWKGSISAAELTDKEFKIQVGITGTKFFISGKEVDQNAFFEQSERYNQGGKTTFTVNIVSCGQEAKS